MGGNYADMMKPMCKKTCGMCGDDDKKNWNKPADCVDDNAAVEKAAGAWGVTECSKDLCEGNYADMMKPMCKKTCGMCGDDDKKDWNKPADCVDDNAAVEK